MVYFSLTIAIWLFYTLWLKIKENNENLKILRDEKLFIKNDNSSKKVKNIIQDYFIIDTLEDLVKFKKIYRQKEKKLFSQNISDYKYNSLYKYLDKLEEAIAKAEEKIHYCLYSPSTLSLDMDLKALQIIGKHVDEMTMKKYKDITDFKDWIIFTYYNAIEEKNYIRECNSLTKETIKEDCLNDVIEYKKIVDSITTRKEKELAVNLFVSKKRKFKHQYFCNAENNDYYSIFVINDIKCAGFPRAEILYNNGCTSVKKALNVKKEELITWSGIGEKISEQIIENQKKLKKIQENRGIFLSKNFLIRYKDYNNNITERKIVVEAIEDTILKGYKLFAYCKLRNEKRSFYEKRILKLINSDNNTTIDNQIDYFKNLAKEMKQWYALNCINMN